MHWNRNDSEMGMAPAQGWHANSWSVSCCCCCCFNKRIKRISIWAFVCGSMGCFVALCINVLYNSAKSSINALCTGTHPEHIPFLLRKVTSLWFVTWCLTVINVRMKITSLQTCALYFNVTPQALSMLPFFFWSLFNFVYMLPFWSHLAQNRKTLVHRLPVLSACCRELHKAPGQTLAPRGLWAHSVLIEFRAWGVLNPRLTS